MQQQRKYRLLFIPRNMRTGTAFYRMLLPASKLNDLGLAEVRVAEQYNDEDAAWADAIIVQQISEMSWMENMVKLQSVNKRIIYEIDDLVYGVDPRANAWSYWHPGGFNLGRVLMLMKQADAVTTTTGRLRNEYALHNRKIYTIPNYLPGELWDKPTKWSSVDHDNFVKRKTDKVIRIGWVGAANHAVDLELVAEIITKICHDNLNVHFVMMGYTPRALFPDLQIYDPETGTGQLEIVKGVELLDYPDRVKSLALDIAIAPLAEIGFNECKSDLKLKEYGSLSIPTVASNIKPYSVSLEDGKTGYLVNNRGKDWYDALDKLIKDQDLRLELGKNARKYYEGNRIDDHIHEWLDVYDQIIQIKYEW